MEPESIELMNQPSNDLTIDANDIGPTVNAMLDLTEFRLASIVAAVLTLKPWLSCSFNAACLVARLASEVGTFLKSSSFMIIARVLFEARPKRFP